MDDRKVTMEVLHIELMEDGCYMFTGRAEVGDRLKAFGSVLQDLSILTDPEFWQSLDKGLRETADDGSSHAFVG